MGIFYIKFEGVTRLYFVFNTGSLNNPSLVHQLAFYALTLLYKFPPDWLEKL